MKTSVRKKNSTMTQSEPTQSLANASKNKQKDIKKVIHLSEEMWYPSDFLAISERFWSSFSDEEIYTHKRHSISPFLVLTHWDF